MNFPIESFRSTVLKINKILTEQEIPFHLTGGVTNVAYAEPRLTQDIDIVIQNKATKHRLPNFLSALSNSDFIFSVPAIELAVSEKKMFQLFDSVESLKLDMYPRELIPGELKRSAQAEVFDQLILPIVSRVDAAASKLVWISKGSHKSRRDFRRIVSTFSTEDKTSFGKIAHSLELTQLAESVLIESDEIIE